MRIKCCQAVINSPVKAAQNSNFLTYKVLQNSF